MSSVGVPLSPHESPWQSCRTEPLTWRVRCSPQQWSGGSVSVEGHSDVSKNWWPGGKRTSELGAEPFRHICHPEALRTRPSGFLWRHFWSRLHYAGIYGVFVTWAMIESLATGDPFNLQPPLPPRGVGEPEDTSAKSPITGLGPPGNQAPLLGCLGVLQKPPN